MLDAVAQLAQDALGNVGRALRDEVDADALASDQADHLLDLADQGGSRVREEGVGLVEEEHELRQLRIADLRHRGVDLGEQPQQEGRIELRIEHQLVGGQHAHHALAVLDGEEVLDVEGRLREELLGALVLQGEQRALDGADAGGGDVAVLAGIFFGVLRHIGEHRAQVFHVDEQQAAVVRHAEDDVHHAGLDLIEAQQAAEQLRTHIGDGGAHGMALLAENVVETCGAPRERGRVEAELRQALLDEAAQAPGLADAGQVALHVGHEAGDACLAETLGDHLQGDRLAGAGGACDEAVPVGHLTYDGDGPVGPVSDIKSVGSVVHISLVFSFSVR